MSFERDGWSIERGVIAADELAPLRALFSSLIPDGDYAPAGLCELTGLAAYYPELAALARDRRFGALAARALGARRIQHLQDSLLYKPARVGGTVEWHQDHTYVGFLVPARVVTLRIALEHETATAGCMHVVDGSHTWGPIDTVRALAEASVTSLVPALSAEQRDAMSRARSLELAPGDVTLHHCLTLHGSGPNESESARRTLILRMFDAECRLDRARLPAGSDVHFPCDDDGHLSPERFAVVHD
jgi:ectoine hydroxylase-related dioxygenase (phytanoyl-CoA dioxygenase family)